MSSAGLLGATPGISDAVAMYSKNGVQKGKKYYNPNDNPKAVSDHCKLKGHFIRDCYRIVGYPPGHPNYNEQKWSEQKGSDYRSNDYPRGDKHKIKRT